MNADELLNLAANPDFIPGIYNYCDRWCERCGLSDRCLNFAQRRSRPPVPVDEEGNLDSEALMAQLEETFSASIELLRNALVAEGIDPDNLETEEIDAERERRDAAIEAHPLNIAAHDYILRVHDWFKAAEPDFQAKGDQWVSFVRMNVPGVDVAAQAIDLRDAVEVIQWQQFTIGEKINTVIFHQFDPNPAVEGMAEHVDGSAKVALIAMDRSISAWTLLLDFFPQRQTTIMEFLAELDELRRALEQHCPNARAFLRPGFDIV